MILPRMGLINNGYNTLLADDRVRAEFKSALQTIMNILQVNVIDGTALGCDDMLVWFRNLGFLSDPDFVRAMQPYADDKMLLARIWRVYTLCWAAKSCLHLPGDYVDLGAYDGHTVDVIRRYVRYRGTKRWWLYDAFDHHPSGKDKAHHGPQLADEVRALFADDDCVTVVRGMLPAELSASPNQIAFMQVDLNSAQAEIACLEMLWPRVVSGGIIVLDDYGASDYRASYDTQKSFFEAQGHVVLECPTSQGIVVKR